MAVMTRKPSGQEDRRGRLPSLFTIAFQLLSRVITAHPAMRQVIPARLRHAVGRFLYIRAITDFPDRVFMRETIIPYLLKRGVSRVLSVGVQFYSVEITE